MSQLFEKLAAQERGFRHREFLSPVLRGSQIRVRIAEVVMTLNVAQPSRFEGWGIFQPIDFKSAKWIREPTMKQRKEYLELFPSVRMVVCHKKDRRCYGVPVTAADARFGLTREVQICLPDNCDQFDTVVVRFDGQRYWFEQHDRQTSRNIGRKLRENLRDNNAPELVNVAGCNQTIREVYEFALLHKLDRGRDTEEIRLRKAIAHGGGEYESHREIGDHYSVMFQVDGESYHSTVRRSDLQIQSAGICLDGFDATFDLQSLVGVMREGQQMGAIYHE